MEVLVGGVALVDLGLGDEDGLTVVEELLEDARVVDGEGVLLFLGVDLGLPFGGPGDAEEGFLEVSPAEGDECVGGEDLAHAVAVPADHLLGVGLGGELAHHLGDVAEAFAPVVREAEAAAGLGRCVRLVRLHDMLHGEAGRIPPMDSTPMTTRTRFFASFLAFGLLTMAGCFGGGGGGGRNQDAGGDAGTALMGQTPMTIILDGSTDDWPEDQVAVGDQYYLYVRFSPGEVITPQANDETLVVSLDVDDSAMTGLVSGDMGIDLEIAFSPPYEGDIGNGTFVAALTPDGEKIQLPAAMLDMTIAPSHASDWFEMRIGRLMTGENVLPREGLLTSGRVRGKMALFN